MNYLATPLRRQLEKTVVEARRLAEIGAREALMALAVHRTEPYSHMNAEQRRLRRRLLAHAPHLGDRGDGHGGHAINKLVDECAYDLWLGMLFASFLARNNLLIEPETGVAVTLGECEELAKEEDTNKWALAARFAHSMLPQVFRSNNPVLKVRLAREHQLKLENLVESLPPEVFVAQDALGWVYQFWQRRDKDRINRSGLKIGANELPAVTQLFTEPYMVQFLLDNSLGAWWISRFPEKPAPVELAYLRRISGGGNEKSRRAGRTPTGQMTCRSSACWIHVAVRGIFWLQRFGCWCRCAWHSSSWILETRSMRYFGTTFTDWKSTSAAWPLPPLRWL